MVENVSGAKPRMSTSSAAPTSRTESLSVPESLSVHRGKVPSESAAQFLALLNEGRKPHAAAAHLATAHASTPEPSAGQPPSPSLPLPSLPLMPQLSPPPTTSTTTEELPRLLQQLCSGLYANTEASASSSRVVLNLDAALAGAAAELVRDGAFLRVRLRARNDSTLSLMSAQRDSLALALGDVTSLHVEVEVLQNDDQSEAHGNGRLR